jgi:large repetitive protein
MVMPLKKTDPMKRILTSLLIFVFFFSTLVAQNPHPFELGFNLGGSWLKSDVKMLKVGSGAGLTFGQTYCMNQTSPLLWGWRFRYLNANTYGQDSKKSFGIANNPVLNGETDTLLDYYHHDTYVYQNYKTHIDELSLEILLGLNKVRQRTNLYPYVFAGAGITKAVAKTDQLDGNGKRYDYVNKIDSTGTSSNSEILTQLNNLNDGTYETLADGNRNPRWKFMPSVGVGLGYEIIKGFSIGLEHKVTWALNDVLDGQRWSGSNSPTGNNDLYHYTSFFLKFSFGRGKSKPAATTPTNNNVTSYTNAAPPVITFSNPGSSPFSSTSQNMNVSGKITNINSASDMGMTQNGTPVNGFAYNSSTQTFTYPATLQQGANTFVVTATNPNGTVSANTTIIYNQPVAVPETPPVVTFTSPASSPFETAQSTAVINGKVLHITGKEQMQVMVNGAVMSSFTYNSSANTFSFNVNLIQGANTVVVSASNSAGNDSKSVTIVYKKETVSAVPPPVVTITNPSANPYTTTISPFQVTATILNITVASQIQVLLNGGPIQTSKLNYNLSTHVLTFNAALMPGANTIEISATNAIGRDAKTETVIFSAPAPQVAAPVVTITNPSSNPFNTTTGTSAISANVLNVSSSSEISVTLNGGSVPTSALNFNVTSHQLTFNVNLIQGANTIVVTAANIGGSDSKTQTIVYKQPVQTPAPVVTITNPASNPFNTSVSSTTINATVMNITAAGQIFVQLNGGPLPSSLLNYNLTSHALTFNVNLIQGANTLIVSATNAIGSDSKTQTIIYTQPVITPAPLITITTPNANPFNTGAAVTTVNATITNVNSATQINATVNGTPTTAFSFNSATLQFSMNTNLIVGANTVVINASNAGGSDSKTQTIIYTQPATVPAPVITITNPGTNPSVSNTAAATINATVLNVSTASQINATVNGAATTAFSFNAATHQFSMNVSLVAGTNTIVINATNAGGSDSKTQTINYAALISPPVVSFIIPATATATTTNSTYAVTAKALNAMSSGQISVKVNGVPLTGFAFQMTTKKITFTANLASGNNTIVVSATNTAGTDSKTINIIYNKPVDPGHPVDPINPDTLANPNGGGHNLNNPLNPMGPEGSKDAGTGSATGTGNEPQFTYINPSANTVSTSDAVYTITVKITNVLSAAGITAKVNGVDVTGITFNNKTKIASLPVPLNMGANTIVVNAANTSGSKSLTYTVTRN